MRYIATTDDYQAIFGLGTDADAAILDAQEGVGPDDTTEWRVYPCSSSLAAAVEVGGGGHGTDWSVHDGMAVLDG